MGQNGTLFLGQFWDKMGQLLTAESCPRKLLSTSDIFSPFRCGPISRGPIWLSPSLIHYPWVIGVFRENTYYEGECGGSIITMTAAVTAAHCICKSKKVDTSDPLILSKLQCIGGKGKVIDPNNLPNEITDDNPIKVTAGSMDYRSPKKVFLIEYAYDYMH